MKITITLKWVLLLWSLVTFSSNAFAGEHEDLVAKYMELSNISKILSNIPDQINTIASQRSLVSKDQEAEKNVITMLMSAYQIDTAKSLCASYILKNTDVNYLKDLVQWLESPLSVKTLKEEQVALTPSFQADMMKYINDLHTNPPSPERVNIMQDLESTLGMAELHTQIGIEIMGGVFDAVNLTKPKKKREKRSVLEKQMKKLRPMLIETTREQAILSLFYMYRNLTDTELQMLIEFYQSPTGKKEMDIIAKSLNIVFKQWSIRFGRELVNFQKEQKCSNH